MRSGSRPNAVRDESASGRGRDALDANALLKCEGIPLPLSERLYCEIPSSTSRLVTLEEPVKVCFQ